MLFGKDSESGKDDNEEVELWRLEVTRRRFRDRRDEVEEGEDGKGGLVPRSVSGDIDSILMADSSRMLIVYRRESRKASVAG